MRYLIIFLLLLPSCAKKITWPASVNLQGLNDLEAQGVINTLKDLSQSSKKELFYFDGDKSDSLKIVITKMDYAHNSTHLGQATPTGATCLIQLNEVVFQDSYGSFFVPVLYHEVGHCAGMGHDPKEGEIMYHVGAPKDYYADAAYQRFFDQLVDFVNRY